MSFAPATAPPKLKKKGPLDLSGLPPHIQEQLATGQPFTGEDGSTIYPDGTYTGAGDSPDDYDGAGAYDTGAGGYNGSAMLAGPEALAFGGQMAPSTNPLEGPLFKRYRQTANASFPGTPGGIGGPAPAEGMDAINPMGDAVGDASDAPGTMPRSLTVEAPRVGTFGAPEQSKASVPYSGRVGRRMSGTRPGRAMGSRRRR